MMGGTIKSPLHWRTIHSNTLISSHSILAQRVKLLVAMVTSSQLSLPVLSAYASPGLSGSALLVPV